MNTKIRLLPLVVITLLILAASPLSVSANHSWNGYHWARTANPFTVKLGDNLSAGWKTYLSNSSTDWNKSTVLETALVAGAAKGKCRPTSGQDEICNGAYGNNGWLGLAQIWVSGSHITQGTVKVNDTYFGLAQYNNTAEKEHVMCQEVGHTFGLDHQDTSGASLNTCMDYYHNTSDSDTKSTSPNQHDYDELVTIYSHLDSTSTVSPMPAAMANGTFDTPGEWGRLVKSQGKSAIYERDFGGGHKVYTFVIWA